MAWQKLAKDNSVAIVAVHHTRKTPGEDPMELILGTNGLASAADTLWIMQSLSNNAARLTVRGRSVQERTIGLKFSEENFQWIWQDPDDLLRSAQKQTVLAHLKAIDPETAGIHEIRGELKNSYGAAKVLVSRMCKAGEIERVGRGQYRTLRSDADEESGCRNPKDRPWYKNRKK